MRAIIVRALPAQLVVVAIVTIVISSAGCGGSDFGTTVDLPSDRHHKLLPTLKPGTVIKLPSARPFNVHDKLWNATPGHEGKANPSADATAKGTAYCLADGADGGTSFAQFQVGHCIDNDSGKPIQAELRMRIDYEHACQAEGKGAKTVSNYAVKVLVKDTAGKVQRNLPLAAHTSDDGRVRWTGTEQTITEVTMQPGLGYYIILAARADAASQKGTSSSASIKVKAFELEIRCKPVTKTKTKTKTPATAKSAAKKGT